MTFKTQAHASIPMFAEVAATLLKLMGHTGTVPGALLAEDLPGAVARLKATVAEHPGSSLDPRPAPGGGRKEQERPCELRRPVLPLIQLLEAAAAANEDLMWDSP